MNQYEEMRRHRNLLSALIITSDDDIETIAEKLETDADLLQRAVADYDSLSKRDKAIVNNAVNAYVNIELDETFEQAEIEDMIEQIEKGADNLDVSLYNLYYTLIANGVIKTNDDFDAMEYYIASLSTHQLKPIFQGLQNETFTMSQLRDIHEVDEGDYFQDNSAFWAFFREIFDDS